MTKITQPSVAIIIINWNNYDDSQKCLHSLKKCDYQNFKTIIVDNDSQDGSGSKLKSEFGEFAHFIFSDKNLGFTGGNNLGIDWILLHSFDYVLLLNNDTIVEPDFLSHLVLFLKKNSKYGAAQPKILLEGDRQKIWNAGGGYFKWLEMTWSIGSNQIDQGQFDEENDTFWITGCAMLVKTDVIKKVGKLDDRFFAYYEDVEWSFRIRKKGFKLRYIPKSIIYHVASGSSKKTKTKEGVIPPIIHYYRTRNHFLLIRNHSNLVSFILSLLYQIMKNAFFIIYLGSIGRFHKVRAILNGHYDGLVRKKYQ